MECPKCRGFMIEEWLADELDEAYVWRCVNCGSLMDGMIARHHRHSGETAPRASCGNL